MSTGILILNYNNAADTIHCIDSIGQFNTAPVKYIVVDNGSTVDGTVETLDRYFREKFEDEYVQVAAGALADGPLPKVTFLKNPVNGGYAVGNNIGLEQACKDPEWRTAGWSLPCCWTGTEKLSTTAAPAFSTETGP